MSLPSRERVNCAIERRPHDRVPRFDTYWDDTLRRWKAEGLTGGEAEAHRYLQADMMAMTPFIWPMPYPGQRKVLSANDNTLLARDEWGAVVREFNDHQTTPEHISWECDSPDAWASRLKDAILSASPILDEQWILLRHKDAMERQLWRYIPTVEPFECLRKLVGDIEFMMGIIEEPDWIADMAETTTTRTLGILESILSMGVQLDGLWIYGDMAYNHATFCSPAQYRELVWPQHKRMCDWAHDRGLTTILHTDGNVNAVVGLYIEAGVDVLQPLECKASMDLGVLVPEYGRDLSFFGNIDVMKLIEGDLEIIEQEIATKFRHGMRHHGYIYHSDHSIPPQVSWPLYKEIVRLVDRYGNYSYQPSFSHPNLPPKSSESSTDRAL